MTSSGTRRNHQVSQEGVLTHGLRLRINATSLRIPCLLSPQAPELQPSRRIAAITCPLV